MSRAFSNLNGPPDWALALIMGAWFGVMLGMGIGPVPW